jgi:hypothetical protein
VIPGTHVLRIGPETWIHWSGSVDRVCKAGLGTGMDVAPEFIGMGLQPESWA